MFPFKDKKSIDDLLKVASAKDYSYETRRDIAETVRSFINSGQAIDIPTAINKTQKIYPYFSIYEIASIFRNNPNNVKSVPVKSVPTESKKIQPEKEKQLGLFDDKKIY